jgi:hypothetical protein
MSYKSDHEFRTDLWQQVTRGLPKDITRECHEHLGNYYREEKDEMNYEDLLKVVKEVMTEHPGWSWNNQRWLQDD